MKEALLHLLRFVISRKLDPHSQHLILRPTIPLEANPQCCYWDLCPLRQHRRSFASGAVTGTGSASREVTLTAENAMKTQWNASEGSETVIFRKNEM